MGLFALVVFIFVIGAISILIKKILKIEKKQRTNLCLILLGTILTFSLLLPFNFILPSVFGIPQFIPYGMVFILPFIIFSSYAIIRRGLLDTKVVRTELLAFGLSVITFFEIIIAQNTVALVFTIVVFILVSFFGILLINSVRKEIKQKEQLTRLSKSLKKSNSRLTQLTHSLERANLRLQELDRQKTEFLSIASHQLRTPLSIAKGYLELLTEGAYGKVTPETKEILKQMDKSNDHLVKLADEFLNVTRIEQGKTKFSFADKDIVELIDRVVNELKIQAKAKKLSIIWRPTKEKKMVNMDDEKIRHVIFNFIDNAIKYSNKGKIQVSWTSEKNGVAVRVKDNGFGFCKEDEVNFFQKFYRGKNVEGINVTGVGLGLFICNKFIEAHEGHVWAHSQGLGKGSEFGFWIPNKRQIKKKAE